MSSGGARPGAGRSRKAVKFARPIAHAEKRIADHLPNLIDRMFDLANGVRVEVNSEDCDAASVFLRPPDRAAIQYLMDRVMGKPTERLEAEIGGPGGGPLVFREVIVERPVGHVDNADEPLED